MSFNPDSLTREQVLTTALDNPIFQACLKQLKEAEGFGPDTIILVDDHSYLLRTFEVNNVVVVVRFDRDGSPSKPRPGAKAQDGCTHLPALIMPGCYSADEHCFDWGQGRCKNQCLLPMMARSTSP